MAQQHGGEIVRVKPSPPPSSPPGSSGSSGAAGAAGAAGGHQHRSGKHANSSCDLLMLSLSKFFSVRENIERAMPIIEGKSEISLRLIDWFITNYSKKHNTIITRNMNGNVVHLNVFLSYRSQLKSYSKTYFDPFRRRDRVRFFYQPERSIDTTIGQLNMFRWILANDVLTHIHDHKEEIEEDMVSTQKENQKKKLNQDNIKVKVVETETGPVTTTRKKRNELSKSIMKNMNKQEGCRVLQFD